MANLESSVHSRTDQQVPNATLSEIANWQLDSEAPAKNINVDLPKLQRGFVWEPGRIITLWDSLLRGFPIGSLLLSEIDEAGAPANESDKYWLLDGQQRATTIAMGYYNPWEDHAHLADKTDSKQGWSLRVFPVSWIELLPESPEKQENRFFLNLVTQSHPWGYQQSGAVLPWGTRNEAFKHFSDPSKPTHYTAWALSNCSGRFS